METLKIDGDLTASTTTCAPCDTAERRREPRYVPMMERAYLGWWEHDAFRTELGRLANISAGGAALEAGAGPGLGEAVWLCVIGPNRTGWVAARLLGRHGAVQRLVFAERFPYELFKSIVWGFPCDQPLETTRPDVEAGAELSPEVSIG